MERTCRTTHGNPLLFVAGPSEKRGFFARPSKQIPSRTFSLKNAFLIAPTFATTCLETALFAITPSRVELGKATHSLGERSKTCSSTIPQNRMMESSGKIKPLKRSSFKNWFLETELATGNSANLTTANLTKMTSPRLHSEAQPFDNAHFQTIHGKDRNPECPKEHSRIAGLQTTTSPKQDSTAPLNSAHFKVAPDSILEDLLRTGRSVNQKAESS